MRQWWDAGREYQQALSRVADEFRVVHEKVARTPVLDRSRRVMRRLEDARDRRAEESRRADAAYTPVRETISGLLFEERRKRQRKVVREENWGWAEGEDGTVLVFRHDVPSPDFPEAITAGRPRMTLWELREVMVESGVLRVARWDEAAVAATDRELCDISLASLWRHHFQEDFYARHVTRPSDDKGYPSGGSGILGTGGYIGSSF
ncbi:hypothetical protein SRB5_31440 [Streptomyces sp. RB5]|uniref:Uncharacterized protein n=1 Tax=Streptomyces smaragdinus TaxID=2585196 RepID=A0A7K0CJR4_9ACTN|nr:hypothetical protein [Streptomyces smaragdinus]